jgi:site-specific recombinase XerD
MAKTNHEQYVSSEVQRFSAYLRSESRTTATVQVYTRHLRTFLTFADKTVRELTKADMQAWKLDLAGHYCENSMVSMIAAVNTYMVKLADRPDLKMLAPRWVEKDKIPLTEDEVMAFLKEARRPMLGEKGHKTFETCYRDYMMSCLLYYAGLRASEVTNLRLSGLDLDHKMLRVHEGKEKDYSMVLLNDDTVQAIKDYLRMTRDSIQPQVGFEDHLILSEQGRLLGRNQLWVTVKRISIRAGITKSVHPHLFRHTMASVMANHGCSVFEIQAQTRHKDISTVQRYVHISADTRRNAYERVFGPEQSRIPQPAQPTPQPTPKPAPGPSLYAQDAQQPITLTMGQLQQLIQAAVGAAPKAPMQGYQ